MTSSRRITSTLQRDMCVGILLSNHSLNHLQLVLYLFMFLLLLCSRITTYQSSLSTLNMLTRLHSRTRTVDVISGFVQNEILYPYSLCMPWQAEHTAGKRSGTAGESWWNTLHPCKLLPFLMFANGWMSKWEVCKAKLQILWIQASPFLLVTTGQLRTL